MPAVRKFSRNFVSIPLWGTLSVMGKSPTYRFPFSQYPAIRIALFLTAGILLGDVAGNAVYSPVLLFGVMADRKSTRLNSSHVAISYAVFCLKKKNMKSGKAH